MSLQIPNIVKLTQDSPKLGEALKEVQDYTNQNVTQKAGNRQLPPHLNGLASVNPTKPPV